MGRKPDDDDVMSDLTGVRAVWWLYKQGMWGYLEDFGLRREDVEDILADFEAHTLVKKRLSKPQARRLVRLVPGLKEASVQLRLTYALKFYDEKDKEMKKNDEKKPAPLRYYHGEVITPNVYESDARCEDLASEHADRINGLGGTIAAGRNFGDAPAILIIGLPEDASLSLDELNTLIPGMTFKPVAVFQTPAVPDMGIPSDEDLAPAPRAEG